MRTKIAAVVVLAVGVPTVRALRERRAVNEAPDPRTEARAEANEATEHAAVALSHARTAGGHAVEYAHDEIEDAGVPAPTKIEQTSPRLVQRLR